MAASRSEIIRMLHRDLMRYTVTGVLMDLPNRHHDRFPDDGDRDPATGAVYGEPQ